MKVLLPASQIPNRSIITKKNESKEYHLHDSITIYNHPNARQMIIGEGIKFLVSSSTGDITAIPDTTMLIVELDSKHILDLLEINK